MKKIDLIAKFAQENKMTKKDATVYVTSLLELMKDGLVADKELDVTGFFNMSIVHKEARTAKNPRTGEAVEVSAKDKAKCRFKKSFVDYINE